LGKFHIDGIPGDGTIEAFLSRSAIEVKLHLGIG
jgi:hypothetical protein